MNVRPSTRPLCTALLVAMTALAGTAAQAAPADPAFASNTVTRAPSGATSRLVDLATSPAARRAVAAARPAKTAHAASATPPSQLAAAPLTPGKVGVAIIEDPVGILMDLGGYTWLEGKGATVRRAGVLAELTDGATAQNEATQVPHAAGQPHAVAPDLLFALLVEATRTQQNRIETLEAEALELRLALADATEARDDQGRAIAAIQSRLGIKP